ncbi:hypothetical protein [Streptomyces chattanoogensis]|uniref:hypothetical protein n=1 Tax=Streptomyces chattanoogensis TaxID=66876 RepID=UPI003679280B
MVGLHFEVRHPVGAARALRDLGITLQQQGSLTAAPAKPRESLALHEHYLGQALLARAGAGAARRPGRQAGGLHAYLRAAAGARHVQRLQGRLVQIEVDVGQCPATALGVARSTSAMSGKPVNVSKPMTRRSEL